MPTYFICLFSELQPVCFTTFCIWYTEYGVPIRNVQEFCHHLLRILKSIFLSDYPSRISVDKNRRILEKFWLEVFTVFPQILSTETILFWIWPYVHKYKCGNHSRAETIQGWKVFAEIRYLSLCQNRGIRMSKNLWFTKLSILQNLMGPNHMTGQFASYKSVI